MTVLNLARSGLALVLGVFCCIASNNNCLAQKLDASNSVIGSARHLVSSIPVLASRKTIRVAPKTVEIYQYEDSSLGGRQPLLLIHGLMGEIHPLFRWQQLAEYLFQDQLFRERYKIYLARYNSQSSLKEISGEFNRAFQDLAPKGGLAIVAISLAGAIVRDTMKDPVIDNSITRVVTLGAFFRGSPLFCADWMQQSIRKRHLSPLYRLDRSIGYKLYFARHKNLILDYGWDNADGQIPPVSETYAKKQDEIALSSCERVGMDQPDRQASDRKFVVYASYLHNHYFPKRKSGLHVLVFSPYTFLRTTLPAHLGRERAALRFLNYLIADAIPGKPGSPSIIYPLNDGISPISSSLLLSDNFVEHSLICDEESIKHIRAHSSAKKQRLFENADHLTFIEGPAPTGSARNVTDVLSLHEKPRPMFAWILNDLLE